MLQRSKKGSKLYILINFDKSWVPAVVCDGIKALLVVARVVLGGPHTAVHRDANEDKEAQRQQDGTHNLKHGHRVLSRDGLSINFSIKKLFILRKYLCSLNHFRI